MSDVMDAPRGQDKANKSNNKHCLTAFEVQRSSAADSEAVANLLAPLTDYQALRLIHLHAVRPELATMLAALAFGGGQS